VPVGPAGHAIRNCLRGNLLVSPGERGDRHGQRHLQWLAYGRARIEDGKINDAEAAKAGGGSAACDRVSGWRARTRAKAWRGASSRPSRQPGEHVPPGGGDNLDRRADDGGVQQSRHVRPARTAEHIAIDRARPRHRLVVERGRYSAYLSSARRRPLARRTPVYRKGRAVHLGMLLGKSASKFRINPRKSWYWNLDRVT